MADHAANGREAIQESQYSNAYHWEMKRTEDVRYRRLTSILSDLIRGGDESPERQVVLDFGCGDGRSTYEIWRDLSRECDDLSVVGYDISATAIRWAEEYVASLTEEPSGLRFVSGDLTACLEHLPRGRAISVVLREVLEHLREDEIDRVLSAIRDSAERVRLVVTVPSTNTPTAKKHYRHYTGDALAAVLERNGFEVSSITGFGFRPARWHRLLSYLKSRLDRAPVVWRLMNGFWRAVSIGNAITLIAVATRRRAAAPEE